jgi:pilus assembly protein CpaF
VSLQEVAGMDGDVIMTNEIMRFRRVSTDEQGHIHGYYEATGIRPRFADELSTQGFHFTEEFFAPNRRFD